MSSYVWPPEGGGSGSGILSINSDTTSAQVIAAGSGITVNTSAGTTTISATGGSTSEHSNGTAGSSITINFSNGPAQSFTTSANVTISLTNPSSGQAYVIRIISGGAYTLTWPGNVLWSIIGPPSNSQTASLIDLINLYYDGTNFYGSYALGY